MRYLLFVLVLACTSACTQKTSSESEPIALPVEDSVFTTPLGKAYPIPDPSEEALEEFEEAKEEFEASPNDVEAVIWYGRRTAYLGKSRQAIAIYT